MCQNILFKFALDNTGLYGSDEGAMKSASNELKGLMSYYNLQLEGICFPLYVPVASSFSEGLPDRRLD